mmetsp:Transcript_19919/g.43292  ORF Transcript_19919/g.43292 Transcript_19919/m.43292 type:complete len:236 (-) Transcript_19919:676-1383(-)
MDVGTRITGRITRDGPLGFLFCGFFCLLFFVSPLSVPLFLLQFFLHLYLLVFFVSLKRRKFFDGISTRNSWALSPCCKSRTMPTGNFVFFHESASIGFFVYHVGTSFFFSQILPCFHQLSVQVGIHQHRIQSFRFVFHTTSNFLLGNFAILTKMLLYKKMKVGLNRLHFFVSDFGGRGCSQAFYLAMIRLSCLWELLRAATLSVTLRYSRYSGTMCYCCSTGWAIDFLCRHGWSP